MTLLKALRAEVKVLGRSSTFIPVDTEAVRPEDVALARQWTAEFELDAIVSTDDNSDRPLLADERGEWLRGDVYLASCAPTIWVRNTLPTTLEKSGWFSQTARTCISAPFVIDAMQTALDQGHRGVCDYETNDDFLLMGPMHVNCRGLPHLPTGDAALPMLAVLANARAKGCTVPALREALPARFACNNRIQNFIRALSQERLIASQIGNDFDRRRAFEQMFGAVSGKVFGLMPWMAFVPRLPTKKSFTCALQAMHSNFAAAPKHCRHNVRYRSRWKRLVFLPLSDRNDEIYSLQQQAAQAQYRLHKGK